MINYIDNVITPTYADEIEHDVLNNLSYTYSRETSWDTEDYKVFKDEYTHDYGQFVLNVFPYIQDTGSQYLQFIKPLIFTIFDKVPEIKFTGINRIKINLLLQQPQAPELHYNIAHYDKPETGYYSVIYYCMDSDGDTFLFDKFAERDSTKSELNIVQRFTPKKNSILVFDSNRFHASSNPRNHKERAVINFVFTTMEKPE